VGRNPSAQQPPPLNRSLPSPFIFGGRIPPLLAPPPPSPHPESPRRRPNQSRSRLKPNHLRGDLRPAPEALEEWESDSNVRIAISPGTEVNAGDRLVVIEAMKMLTTVSALVDGIIKDILVKKGVQVDSDDLLVVMEQ
jgi:biotin carboxyl carrier protein